jgi:tRNA A37 N6-isopentenylltransferase MiaA
LTKEEKYELLKQYDSLIAEKVHKNNEQKINLFLERMILSKRKISDNYQKLTHELKSNNTIVFWLRNSNKEELLGMITKRIHKMVDKAGITEILSIYHYLHIHRAVNLKEENVSNYEEYSGAASSIGIKEFLPLYLEVRQQLLNLIPVQ